MLLAESAFKCHSSELHFDLLDDELPLLGLAVHDLIQKLQNGCLLAARLAQQVSSSHRPHRQTDIRQYMNKHEQTRMDGYP